MLLSVVIPVFNTEENLSTCLDSIGNQTFQKFEVILVDDGSTDRSSTICDEYAEKDIRFHIFHQCNKGVSAARNFGISQATGDYITFIDSDDYVFPDYFANITQKISKDKPDAVVTAGYFWGSKDNYRKVCLPIPATIPIKNNFLFELLADHIYPSGLVFSTFKRSVVQKILLDESIYFYEDLDYQLRAGRFLQHISVNYNLGYLYREGSQTHCSFTKKTVSCFIIIEKMKKGEINLDQKLQAKFQYNFIISNALIAAKDKTHNVKLDVVLKKRAWDFCRTKEWFTSFKSSYVWILLISISPNLYYRLYRMKHKNL